MNSPSGILASRKGPGFPGRKDDADAECGVSGTGQSVGDCG